MTMTSHRSETLIDSLVLDYEIMNDSSKDDLHKRVYKAVTGEDVYAR